MAIGVLQDSASADGRGSPRTKSFAHKLSSNRFECLVLEYADLSEVPDRCFDSEFVRCRFKIEVLFKFRRIKYVVVFALVQHLGHFPKLFREKASKIQKHSRERKILHFLPEFARNQLHELAGCQGRSGGRKMPHLVEGGFFFRQEI